MDTSLTASEKKKTKNFELAIITVKSEKYKKKSNSELVTSVLRSFT